jgi:nitroimidazol reductase NimA-like FMN-containing flavoprotein (pyridoxamine 5'-phosphate oxidase superfamily)
MKYRSVTGFGEAHIVDDPEEKERASKIIVKHYSGDPYEYTESAPGDVALFEIEVRSMTGKKSGY